MDHIRLRFTGSQQLVCFTCEMWRFIRYQCPPIDFAFALLERAYSKTESNMSSDEKFHELVKYIAAWDMDVAKLSGAQ